MDSLLLLIRLRSLTRMKSLLCHILFIVGSCVPVLAYNSHGGLRYPYAINQNYLDINNFVLNTGLNSTFDPSRGNGGYFNHDFDDGNPDVHGNIVRPCQSYDTFCIRKFFAEHSKCKISGRQIPNPFFRAQSTVTYPSANMSAYVTTAIYTGIENARVEEFYINTVTDNLVIALAFDAITLGSNYTSLKFYLRGREPELHFGFGSLIYEQITVTVVIPGLRDLRLDRAEITTYANNPLLPFAVSPTLALSTSPEVIAMTTYFLTAGVQIEHIEELSTEGTFYASNYIQYNICDFGLEVL